MRYFVLAADYDGTLADAGHIARETVEGLDRLTAKGRQLVVVTGREISELVRICPYLERFAFVVAENGGVLYHPVSKQQTILADPPPSKFVDALRRHGVTPLSVGKVLVATREPNEGAVLEVIRDLGLEMQVIFNKGAVMALPSGVNKATGLEHALNELRISVHNVVGIGDAENDLAFLERCEAAVAVANALPSTKQKADFVTARDNGKGVVELIDKLIESDLRELEPRNRHQVPIGYTDRQEPVLVPPYSTSLLVAGTSGAGKSTFATGFIEHLVAKGYQFCIIDPEGDYRDFQNTPVLGDPQREPGLEEIIRLLENPLQNLVINLLAIRLEDRPHFFERILSALLGLRGRTGHPHWIVIDEAHHMLPDSREVALGRYPPNMRGIMFITPHPDHMSPAVIAATELIVALGDYPDMAIQAFARLHNRRIGDLNVFELAAGEAFAWRADAGGPPIRFRTVAPRGAHRPGFV